MKEIVGDMVIYRLNKNDIFSKSDICPQVSYRSLNW